MSNASAHYDFMLAQILNTGMHGKRVLDFGCGAGDIVRAGRAAGVDMIGADIFHITDTVRNAHIASGEMGQTIFEVVDGRLPFQDGSMDMVFANMVFEHVEDMGLALDEISRVLKPGGVFLNAFPTSGSFRECHCGIPFAHWLQRKPKLQVAYLRAMRSLGLGYGKAGRTVEEWASSFADYLQRFTFYRSLRDVKRAHLRRFKTIERREFDYAFHRLMKLSRPAAALATLPIVRRGVSEFISRFGFVVLVARK